MQIALNKAKRGIGFVEPNPYVGAVLTKNGKILSTGYHKVFGGPHAEIDAISKIKSAQGATLYVTLEPCCHTGKTPPCTDAIIKSGISQIFVATIDSNRLVNGLGIKKLKSAGIKINVGLLNDNARKLNRHFFYYKKTDLPWITAKWAMTLDGKIASKTGESKWITSEKARALVKKLRTEYQAVMIGVRTVIKDNPNLLGTTRIILDSRAQTPLKCMLVKTAKENRTIIVTLNGKGKKLKSKGCEIIEMRTMNLKNIAKELAKKGIIKILAEGGSRLFGSLFDSNLIQEAYVFIAPKIMGGQESISPIGGIGKTLNNALFLKNVNIKKVGSDFLIHGHVEN